jgi:hypothetical protein
MQFPGKIYPQPDSATVVHCTVGNTSVFASSKNFHVFEPPDSANIIVYVMAWGRKWKDVSNSQHLLELCWVFSVYCLIMSRGPGSNLYYFHFREEKTQTKSFTPNCKAVHWKPLGIQ